MLRFIIIYFLLSASVFAARSYRLSESLMREMMCLHNMNEEYCKEWINKGTITLYKYRRIEEGCLRGTQFLCTYIVYVQDRMPTPMNNEIVALSEFGCKSGNGVHCLILASINPIKSEKMNYFKKACQLKEPVGCQKLSKMTKAKDGKVKVNVENIKKGIKDALNKMMKGKK